jgi:hypothetical protein
MLHQIICVALSNLIHAGFPFQLWNIDMQSVGCSRGNFGQNLENPSIFQAVLEEM